MYISMSESSHLCAMCAARSATTRPVRPRRILKIPVMSIEATCHIPLGNPERIPDGKPDGIVLYLNAGFRRSCFRLRWSLMILFVIY